MWKTTGKKEEEEEQQQQQKKIRRKEIIKIWAEINEKNERNNSKD